MKALLCRERSAVEFMDMTEGIGGSRRFKPYMVLHDGKNHVSLIFDGCKSHRCDHYDHEVECLDVVSLDAETNPSQRL